MTRFIIKTTTITSLFFLLCSFTDNSVKNTPENQSCYNELEFTNFTLVDQGPSMYKTKELITYENWFKKEYKVFPATYAKIYKSQTYLDMPIRNCYSQFLYNGSSQTIQYTSSRSTNINFAQSTTYSNTMFSEYSNRQMSSAGIGITLDDIDLNNELKEDTMFSISETYYSSFYFEMSKTYTFEEIISANYTFNNNFGFPVYSELNIRMKFIVYKVNNYQAGHVQTKIDKGIGGADYTYEIGPTNILLSTYYFFMPVENSYYKIDYSFDHPETGKRIHVDSRKENNIIFL